MKLYTEEQLKKAIAMATTSKYYHKLEFYSEDEVIQELKPIKLPSDEEIYEASLEENNDDLSPAEEFEQGAKWMREQIQGGNK